MKVAIIPDSAMILLNQVRKSNHQLLSHYNDIYSENEFQEKNKEIKKKDIHKSYEKSIDYMPNLEPIKGIEYTGMEAPSGVLGRLSIEGPIINRADAVIMLNGGSDNHMYDTLNELILFGGNGCVNTRRVMESLIKRRGIPFLKLEYPNTREDIIDIIDEINNFLNYLSDLEEGKTNKPYVKKHEKRVKDSKINVDELNEIIRSNK